MTILMTTDTVGGVWTYCMDLCNALKPYNAVVHLVTMGEEMKAWQRNEVDQLPNVVVHETAYKLEWMQDPWTDVEKCGHYLLQLEEEVKPDIVHLNCYAYGSYPFKAPVVVVAHSDVWSWFLEVTGTEPGAEWNGYFSWVQNGLLGADRVIAPTETKLNRIKAVYGITDGLFIYNSRDEKLFSQRQKQDVVFAMGRIWDEAKNTKLLMESAPMITAPVRIAGEDRFEQNKLSLKGSNCTFLGKLSTRQIAEELATASIYVLPAKYEPFGLSALEAALSDCALVLGDIPTLREIWGDAAIYVDTDDAPALADAVNALLQQPSLRMDLAERAKQRARLYSMKIMVQQYWQLYQQAVAEKRIVQKEETV